MQETDTKNTKTVTDNVQETEIACGCVNAPNQFPPEGSSADNEAVDGDAPTEVLPLNIVYHLKCRTS